MPSPVRRPRGSPSRRGAPLHERSDSQTNEKAVPNLRMVGDPEASYFKSSPYPTKSSHVLPSTTSSNRPDLGTAGDPQRTGHISHHVQDHSRGKLYRGPELSGAPLGSDRSPGSDHPFQAGWTSETAMEDNGLVTRDNISPRDSFRGGQEQRRLSNDSVVQLPSLLPRSDDRPFTPYHDSGTERLPASKDSDRSFNSTGTMHVKKMRDGKKRASYSAFPFIRPSSSKSSLGTGTPQRLRHEPSSSSGYVSPPSPSTPISPTFPPSADRLPSAVPHYASFPAAAPPGDAEIQYPVIKPQSTSASFADSGPLPQAPPHVMDRGQERWNPHLSTVPSEGTGSNSGERSSQGTWPLGSSRGSKSSSNMRSPRRSSDYPPMPRLSSEWSNANGGSSDLPSMPSPSPSGFPSPPQHPGFQGARPGQGRNTAPQPTVRIIDGPKDTTDEHRPDRQSIGIAQTGSLKPHDHRQSVTMRPSSRASFFRDSIPAWAKAYYARPNSAVLAARPDSRLDGLSADKASSNPMNSRRIRDSRLQWSSRPKELTLAQLHGGAERRISSTWSPHLWHDRTSLGRRRSLFKAPTVDSAAHGRPASRRNVQVVCFAVGFIMPLLWIIASFLPLPGMPESDLSKGKGHIQAGNDSEKQSGPFDEAQYENARWWRNINRIMAVFGVIIIAAIIALAIVGSH